MKIVLRVILKTVLKVVSSAMIILSFQVQAWESTASDNSAASAVDIKKSTKHDAWLKQRFSEQHEKIIPVVAVADMFFSCNKARHTDESNYPLEYLVNLMDKNTLAEKLVHCLGEDTMQSDVALNFGLLGCFHEQLAHLPKVEQQQKMLLVKQAMNGLSHQERKKSFTQCVTEQAIHYLK